MPKTTEQLAGSKAGETLETNGFGGQERPLRPSGVYELKNNDGEVVDTIIVKTHPKFGDSQAAAVERVGYHYIREAKPEEVKAIEVDVKTLALEGTDTETAKGIQARLSALEAESKQKDETIAALRAEQDSGSADGDVKADAKDEARAEATRQVQARQEGDQGPLDNPDEDENDAPKEKSFSSLNRAELEELAESEGITIPEEADTNAKIREAITSAREEKEGK